MRMQDKVEQGNRETDAPIVRRHQYTSAWVVYPIARVYHHSALPVRIARASALVYASLLPPASLELDPYFDRWPIPEGADGVTLLIAHKDSVRVDSAKVSK
jgi:hypothetical protein